MPEMARQQTASKPGQLAVQNSNSSSCVFKPISSPGKLESLGLTPVPKVRCHHSMCGKHAYSRLASNSGWPGYGPCGIKYPLKYPLHQEPDTTFFVLPYCCTNVLPHFLLQVRVRPTSMKKKKPSALDKQYRHVALLQRHNRRAAAQQAQQQEEQQRQQQELAGFSQQLRASILAGGRLQIIIAS
jgi:hypothetical protein